MTGCSRGIAWVAFQHVYILSKVLAEFHVIKGKKVAVRKVKRKTYKISSVKTNPEVQKDFLMLFAKEISKLWNFVSKMESE